MHIITARKIIIEISCLVMQSADLTYIYARS